MSDSRDDRIESYYHQSAWDLAERIVDLEDQAALQGDRLILDGEVRKVYEADLQHIEEDHFGYFVWANRDPEVE